MVVLRTSPPPHVHDSTSAAEATRGGNAEKRARTDTQTQTECNKSGGGGGGCLLPELLVQLILVCEAGGGRDCGHDERRQGEEPRDSAAASRSFQENS